MKKINLILIILFFNNCSTVNKIIESTIYTDWGKPKKLRKKMLNRIINDKSLDSFGKDIFIVENFHLSQGNPKSSYIIACISIEEKLREWYYISRKQKKVELYDTTHNSDDDEKLIDSISRWVKEGNIKKFKKYEKNRVSGHGYYFVTVLNSKKKFKKTYKFDEFYID